MKPLFTLKSWTQPWTFHGRIVSIACSLLMLLATLPLGGATCNSGPQVSGLFDANSVFDAGTIILSGSPEDRRLAWVTDTAGMTWDFFGTRDVDGVPVAADHVEVSKGTTTMTLLLNGAGLVERIETVDSATGASAAAQFTYLGGRRIRIDVYDAVTQDPASPTASETVTVPESSVSPDIALKLDSVRGRKADSWREVRRKALESAMRRAIAGSEPIASAKEGAPAKEATAVIEAKATFRVKVETESGDPVTDATVAIDVTGPDRAPNVVAPHTSGGDYQAEITLAKAAELGQSIKECEKMLLIGGLTTGAILFIVGAAAGAIGTAVVTTIGTLFNFAGGATSLVSAASFIKDRYDNGGICSMIVDYIADTADGNLKVQAKIIDHKTRPEIVGASSARFTVPITAIAGGSQSVWRLGTNGGPGIVVADPASGGLSNVQVGQRTVTLTFTDTGTEDGDQVSVTRSGISAGATQTETVFQGTLTNNGISKTVTLSPGPNTITVTALNTGTLGPNTAGLAISGVVSGSSSQSWSLSTGETGVFTVVAP